MSNPIPFKKIGNHHLYYGIAFTTFGLFNYIMGISGGVENLSWLWLSVTGFGIFCIIDDIVEHKITSDTPLRILYRLIFKIKE